MSSVALADVLLPQRSRTLDAALVVGASLLTALAAQAAVPLPFTPVPITGQSFAVVLTGMLLGSRRGGLAMLLYLLEGAVGLPFFAGGSGGPLVFARPTAGYLLAFPLAAFVAGWLAERGFDRRFATTWLSMWLASSVLFIPGLLVLSLFVGTHGLLGLLAMGLFPFLPAEVIKATLAALALPRLRRSLTP